MMPWESGRGSAAGLDLVGHGSVMKFLVSPPGQRSGWGPPPQSILHWLASGSWGWVTVIRRPLTTSLWKSILVHTRAQPNPHSVGTLSFQVHSWPHSMTSPEGPQKLREADGRLCSASPLPGAFIPECKVPFAHTARQKLAALCFVTEQYTA